MGTTTDDTTWMRRALELAALGPAVDPNPRVGCVVVAPGPDGQPVRFSLDAEATLDVARAVAEWGGRTRHSEVNVPPMSLADGLAHLMARPERGEVFERAWRLAKETL